MPRVKEFQKLVTRRFLVETLTDVIEEVLASSADRDAEPVTINLTFKEFKQLKGFQGSFLFMLELTNAILGRMLRFFVLKFPDAMSSLPELLVCTDAVQKEAAEELVKEMTKKYGQATEKEIQAVDTLCVDNDKANRATLNELADDKKRSA